MTTAQRTVHAATPTWPAAVRAALADIKFAHTVFAMPFAILGAAMAFDPSRQTTATAALALALVVVAMVAARTFAMLVNRLADHRFDALNPRTSTRAVPEGRLPPARGWVIAVASAALFIAAAAAFYPVAQNPWPLALAPPVLAWIALYSYTKRFTAAAHFFLGSALAMSPLCAALAVDPATFGLAGGHAASEAAARGADGAGWRWGEWERTGTALCALAGFVGCWVAGFDIAYALQDVEFDRRVGLRSIPANCGPGRALRLSRACHVAAVCALVGAVVAEPRFGAITASAVVAVGLLLVYEHVVLHRRGVAGLPIAFFTVNGLVSIVFAGAGVVDLMV